MKVWMDTMRMETNQDAIECTAHLNIAGEDVRLSVLSFGETNDAFDKMEKVLDSIDILGRIDEKVRVY